MDLFLQQRLVVVAGGSSGIGLACAQAFAAEGARVAIVSRSHQRLEQAQRVCEEAGLHVHPFAGDLSDADQAQAIIDAISARHGAINVLVNSAGAAARHPVSQLTPAHYLEAFSAKFCPYINTQHAVLAHFLGQAQPSLRAVVNIVGIGGRVAMPEHVAGGAANAALILTSQGLAQAYGCQGIRINVINPGFTLTPRTQATLERMAQRSGESLEQTLARQQASIPMGRFARAGEVADLALFLASPRASYLSGAVINMDGGAYPGA
ncbi:SDR family oxidoreductase [Pseudomonas canadensis]|uniref:SDR family oxidoreductase n=1 Tax=Pseudomonas canadensis TaxID=915099 RepID=A0ABZ1ACS6_9PSED|nr:SDR family oxidoreductase [Pseudomonas canadensis]WRI26927.1 SDR family oxidoreductase [Pseudomonas canadensis]